MTHLNLSCIYGKEFSYVYPAPTIGRSIFISNNPDLENEVQSMDWEFLLDEKQVLTEDYRISSCQAKYVKFLQCLKDYSPLNGFSEILYFDHKFRVTDEHIRWLRGNTAPDAALLLRKTPKHKGSVFDEVKAALRQPRYVETMPQTQNWIHEKVSTPDYSSDVRIMKTGLLYYKDQKSVRGLLDDVFHTTWKLEQPECQILFAILFQRYKEVIQVVEWSDLEPDWETPKG